MMDLEYRAKAGMIVFAPRGASPDLGEFYYSCFLFYVFYLFTYFYLYRKYTPAIHKFRAQKGICSKISSSPASRQAPVLSVCFVSFRIILYMDKQI